jgi:A/G-specific adenine glycosylase
LHEAAREVRDQYGGRVPDDPHEISKLKGVGPYTAGAILSIAYGKREPAVDGNVMRVFARLFDIRKDIQKPGTKKLF